MMKKTGIVLFSAVLVFVSAIGFSAGRSKTPVDMTSPVGYWKTIDDVTGQPKSILEIRQTDQHELRGVVVKLFKGALQTCSACEGSLKDKPILGMEVIYGLHQNPKNTLAWVGGTALDPKNGKTYHFLVTLMDQGQKLYARGYIGFPLFGRTQIWERVSEKDAH